MSSILKYQESRQNVGNTDPLPTQKPVHDTDELSPVQPEPDQHWQDIKSELANGHSKEPPLAELVEIEV